MSRVFLSHSSRDSRQAIAVKAWLIEQEPGLADEIFLDLDPHTGIRPGERWWQALQQANTRCEAVICLLSKNWEASLECQTEFRYAENLNKTILVARLKPVPDTNITSEWQRCDLFPGHGLTTEANIGDGGQPVVLDTVGLQRLLEALRALGIGAEHFPWPPPNDPDRAPYRGWAPLEEADAAVFFGRDAQILRGLDALHGMRSTGVESLFVILGPSGAGKSSFLRAGLLPRLRRDDRRFLPLPIVRPERAVLTGERGLAHAIHQLRTDLGLPHPVLGEIKNACHPDNVDRLRGWLQEVRQTARARLLDVAAEQPASTLVLPVDQAAAGHPALPDTGAFFDGGVGAFMGNDDDGWGDGTVLVPLMRVLLLIAVVALLFTARYPKGLYDFVLGINRWAIRVQAYTSLMRDEYPPFRLDMGPREPQPPAPPQSAR